VCNFFFENICILALVKRKICQKFKLWKSYTLHYTQIHAFVIFAEPKLQWILVWFFAHW
jgi:hypothetical protein